MVLKTKIKPYNTRHRRGGDLVCNGLSPRTPDYAYKCLITIPTPKRPRPKNHPNKSTVEPPEASIFVPTANVGDF